MQRRPGTRFAQEAHVLRFDQQPMLGCAVEDIRELQPPRERGKGLLEASHVVTRVEVTNMVALPGVGATPPDFDGRSGHVGERCCLRASKGSPTTNSASNTVAPRPRA